MEIQTVIAEKESFRYDTLNYQIQAIRLVKVQPQPDSSDEVRCDLYHFVLDQAPQYNALSYTWGSDQDEQRIFVNDQPVRVRKSLFTFLEFASRNLSENFIWVDSICIDQSSVQERNHQVAMMADIYENAHTVHAWLFPVPECVALLVDCVNLSETEHILPNDAHLLSEAIQSLIEIPYWTRVWVKQELFLAQRVNLMCCGIIINWSRFFLFIERFAASSNAMVGLQSMIENSEFHRHRVRRKGKLLVSSGHRNPTSKSSMRMIDVLSAAGCLDIRDRVYAVLALVVDGRSFEINYSEDVATLAHRTFCHFGQTIELFNAILNILEVREDVLRYKVRFEVVTAILIHDFLSDLDKQELLLVSRYITRRLKHIASVNRIKDGEAETRSGPYFSLAKEYDELIINTRQRLNQSLRSLVYQREAVLGTFQLVMAVLKFASTACETERNQSHQLILLLQLLKVDLLYFWKASHAIACLQAGIHQLPNSTQILRMPGDTGGNLIFRVNATLLHLHYICMNYFENSVVAPESPFDTARIPMCSKCTSLLAPAHFRTNVVLYMILKFGGIELNLMTEDPYHYHVCITWRRAKSPVPTRSWLGGNFHELMSNHLQPQNGICTDLDGYVIIPKQYFWEVLGFTDAAPSHIDDDRIRFQKEKRSSGGSDPAHFWIS